MDVQQAVYKAIEANGPITLLELNAAIKSQGATGPEISIALRELQRARAIRKHGVMWSVEPPDPYGMERHRKRR